MPRQNFHLFIIAAITLLCSTQALAWKVKTHQLLSQRAAEHSRTNTTNYLQKIGLEGFEQSIWLGNTLKKIVVWIQDGAEREDASNIFEQIAGRGRFTNHFHNPLEPWEQAGLHDFQSGMSSLLWAQTPSAQETFREGDWSWQIIREYYYHALTAPTARERQGFFAETFRGLGHQMHLIQDAAQPDHVRNDAHPLDAFWEYNWFGSLFFESWAAKNLDIIQSLAATPLFPAIDLTIASYGLAAISQLIDTDQYDGITPTDSLAQGMAEYTNANFFSDDTLFAAERYTVGHKYYSPYPKQSSTNLQDYLDQQLLPETVVAKDGVPDVGFWIAKTQDGEIIDHFVKPTYFTADAYQAEKQKGGSGVVYQRTFYRDEESHKAYASKLIPRAVGYSAALIDYFFRGDITIEQEDMGPGYVIVNHTAEEMHGTFELYYDNKYSQQRTLLWQGTFTLGAQNSGTNRSDPIDITGPVEAEKPGEYMLVFQGQLGAEEDAIVGRVVQLVTTLTGRLIDGEGRTPAGVTVVAVAGEEPHLYKRGVSADTNGVFVIENFPADRGDIHLEVWYDCHPCRTPREGKGNMIPRDQWLLIGNWGMVPSPGLDFPPAWDVLTPFPLVKYRAKTDALTPFLNETVDFGNVSVEYVSVLVEQVTVPGTRGIEFGIWGSFPAEIYLYPGNGNIVLEHFYPYHVYLYPGSEFSQLTWCREDGLTIPRLFTYSDYLTNVFWVQAPTLSQGRLLPAFDDINGQVIGTYDLEFYYTVWGNYNLAGGYVDGCWCVQAPCALDQSLVDVPVRKTGLKVMVKVYR